MLSNECSSPSGKHDCYGYVIRFAGRHGDASKRYLDDCECGCHGQR